MSISDYLIKKEYIVTVNDFQDLDSIYSDIETQGKTPPNLDLTRSVECLHRRPTSRNTHYLLADWEAVELKNDPRIKSVTLAPYYLGIKAGTTAVSQTSSNWDKSSSTSAAMKNWGLLRCNEGVQRAGWGGTGYDGNGTGTPAATGTIDLTQTGRNVDVVVCDLNGIVWNHPEYAVNADGTGGTRTQQYNWYQHNAEIGNGSNGTYTYGTGDHSTHVAGTIAGNTQGWARSANIYNLYYDTGNPGNFSYVFDYIRAFHRNKSINNNTGRKNPTIVNNSWGQSIFPSEWSFSDITAVTYRGTRYTPSGATTYTGYSGVCTSNQRLATLAGFENYGNRITTVGPYTPPGGSILSKPGTWSQQGQQAYFIELSQPDSSYALGIQGPADLNLIHNVAIDAISGSMSLAGEIIITNSSAVEVYRFTAIEQSTNNGGTIEINIQENLVNLPNNEQYTVTFSTVINVSGVANPSFATAMSLTVVTDSHSATAGVTTITNNLLGAASLTSSTTPTVGNNDDGYWTLNLPFNITYLGTSYSTIYVSTNHYLTFGGGSTLYTNLNATTPNLPKIMWSCADNSVQRIYYGVEGTGSGTYTVTNSGASDYIINSESDPTLTLQRGGTYTFNVSAGGHPFWIQTVSGAYSSGNIYNTGVTNNGTQNGTITFTVPNNAPSTLYYVCQFHSSMRGTINIVAGTRTYRVRVEGAAAVSGTLGSPNMVNEYVFYEATPAQIDLQLGANGRKTVGGGFTTEQLNGWGFISGQRIPARVAACDVDLEDLYAEGIVMVGAAGNGRWKHDVPGGLDWNNTFEMASRYPGSVAQPYYYMRGTSPTANDNSTNGDYELPSICVGSIDSIQIDQKVSYSDCGPGVDLFAPGTYIISALPSGTADPRSASYYLGKFSGTSMASPQVCGVLACALEIYPNMNQSQAKAYILAYAKQSQLIATTGGAADGQDLQGAANLVLYYYKERFLNGNTFPKINYKPRPTTGSVYPRPRIRRTL
jgi:hypothetical protein